ncbi:MAG: nucleoside-diphosphate kinase [Candidatus Latescibacteria bacterium]|nr:nucleoside-diphosphate kinase [Candidatus Latescibacterota bacterium]
MVEKTLLMIKPDAVGAGHTGSILGRLEQEGFKIVALKKTRLSDEKARLFYAVHQERPFYDDLVTFMTSGPVVPVLLFKEDAISSLRELVGNTDTALADDGTIRQLYGTDKQMNAVHASDATQTAATEAAFFFSELERL